MSSRCRRSLRLLRFRSGFVGQTRIRLVVKVVAEIVERGIDHVRCGFLRSLMRTVRRAEGSGGELRQRDVERARAQRFAPGGQDGIGGQRVQQLFDQVASDLVVFNAVFGRRFCPCRGQIEDETGLCEPQPVPRLVEAPEHPFGLGGGVAAHDIVPHCPP